MRGSKNWARKKPPGSLAAFLGIFGCLQASLSIRQRCEIAKEIKVKLSGHGGNIGQAVWLDSVCLGLAPARGFHAALRDGLAGYCASFCKTTGRGRNQRDGEASL
jgi:hypothetical protein